MKKVTAKQIEKLQALAEKAWKARDKFEAEFYRLEASNGWAEACDAKGMAQNTQPGDWLC